ncbi:MAG TPA: ATP-binding protein [Firmicutes bacterium]|nr:ATP-binding protein [Bacillota bacterium]
MKDGLGKHIGTVVGNTSPQEFRFFLRRFEGKLGDLVTVTMDIPGDQGTKRVITWGRVVELERSNPFLPLEAGLELADEGLEIMDTVLSTSRDQIHARAIVLGYTLPGDIETLMPLNYPVSPGAEVRLPPAEAVQALLTGDEKVNRLRLGTLMGRKDVEVSLKTNAIVARHMAILAMTGGGKTVAARRIIRELLARRYPVLIFDPHGDYLGLWENRQVLSGAQVKLFYPYLQVTEDSRDLIAYLVRQLTQGFSDAQREKYEEAANSVALGEDPLPITNFVERVLQELGRTDARHPGTLPAVKRGLRFVKQQVEAMELSNRRLRQRLEGYPFEPMPDPVIAPEKYVQPGQASIVYLGGYDHLTQSTVVAIVLKNLFEVRASLTNRIPPLLAVIEEAHNFIPSRTEGQTESPSVEVIRKVITEGRKFGVGLLLISQRPNRLDETTLSQCNTFLIFRLVNPRDQAFVERVMENLSPADAKLLPGFGPGQGIVSGQAVRFPLVIQVEYDRDLMSKNLADEDFVAQVERWQASPTAEAVRRSEAIERVLDQI